MEDKVSIIVPIYNVEKYLKKCVNSILNQTYKNIEVLLIDDCSTDNSGDIAKQYEQKDNRCKYIRREKNGGLSAARNTGVEHATGEYLSFVDSDDWVSENFILHLIDKAKEQDADITVCDYIMIDDNGKETPGNTLENLDDSSSIEEKIAYIRNHVVTKLYNREFFMKQNLKFPEEIKRAAEMGLSIPMLTRTNKIAILNEALYYYYQRSNSISNNRKPERIDLSFYSKAFKNVIKNSKGLYPEEIEYHGILEMIYGKTMLMIRHKYSNEEIKEHLKKFDKKFPNWRKNKYIKNMVFLKKFFVKIASWKFITLLRIMVEINERRK